MPRAAIILIAIVAILVIGAILLASTSGEVPQVRVEQPVANASAN